jgi:pimeloyl-ACP methyl ester carboxylesterase
VADKQQLILIPGLVCDAAVWRHQTAHPNFVCEMVGRVGTDVYVRRQRAIGSRRDSRELLRDARQPVRCICGRQDGMSTVDEHIEIAELAPHGRFSLTEECGHMTILERPHAATALLRDWLLYDH